MTYGLIASLILLLVAFGFCLRYVFSNDVAGLRISLDQVTALNDQGRITKAVLKDADSELVGTYDVLTNEVNPKTGRPSARTPRWASPFTRRGGLLRNRSRLAGRTPQAPGAGPLRAVNSWHPSPAHPPQAASRHADGAGRCRDAGNRGAVAVALRGRAARRIVRVVRHVGARKEPSARAACCRRTAPGAVARTHAPRAAATDCTARAPAARDLSDTDGDLRCC